MTLREGCWAHVLVGGAPRLYHVTVPEVEAVAAVGSGDAFLAGYIAATYRGLTAPECLRYGVACGAESTGRLGAGLIDVREVDRLLAGVVASELTAPAGVG
jgi:1-phosphofructokinase/tagatose 6-phosphate kinase